METIQWKVDGMTCANCALAINKYLGKQGAQNIRVNPIDGDVSFDIVESTSTHELKEGIHDLGYNVVDTQSPGGKQKTRLLSTQTQRLIFCLPFTLVLMLHMLERWIPLHWLMNPWLQLGLCIPVYLVGMSFFGKSAHPEHPQPDAQHECTGCTGRISRILLQPDGNLDGTR